MAKKVEGYIKLQIPAGKATPAPPVGPALGQHGVNIVQFTKDFNARTANQEGMIIPVVITVYQGNGVVETLSVPVKGGKRYRLTVRGERGFRQGESSSLLVRYYFRKTAGGKSISGNKESLRVGNPAKPLVYEILAPKDAKWFSLWVMWGKFLGYKLEEL